MPNQSRVVTLNGFGITNKKPPETLSKFFAIKKSRLWKFSSKSALKSLENEKTPVQVPKTLEKGLR